VNAYNGLVFHWGVAFPVVAFTGPASLYMFSKIAFDGLPGAPSQRQIVKASILMGALLITIYFLQTYLYVTAGSYYYECFNETYATLK
jgi:hypothetical protein